MDPITLALTGQLPFVILAAALAAFPFSLLLLRLYRRQVIRTMGTRVRAEVEKTSDLQPRSPAQQNTLDKPPLLVTELDASEPRGEFARDLYHRLRASPWRGARLYALGGVVFTLVMTSAVLVSSGIELSPVQFLLVFWVYGWPIVLTVNLVGASARRDRFFIVSGYFVVLLVLSVAAVALSTDFTLVQLTTLWMITNLPPTLLLLAFLARPIRAVGPLVLTFMILAFTGSVFALAIAGSHEALLSTIAAFAFNLGATATATFFAIVLLGFVLFAALGWLALGWLRRGYVSKRLSDQSISIDALWLMFGIVQSVGMAFEGVYWMLSGVLAFVAYKLTVRAGFRLRPAPASVGQSSNTRLLLLRVFSLGKRSERLFDRVTKHWRYLGNVQLIAGPDLAMTTVEPHEFLSFVSGGLAGSFIDGERALQSRMNNLDADPDFDRRFRVNDFFCYDDTWEGVLSRLVKESDVVMMDLRGFSPQNAGCVRELQELVNVIALQRVVLVIDGTTDLPFLRQSLEHLWKHVKPISPNLTKAPAEVRLFRLTGLGSRQLRGLLACLTVAAAG